MTPKAKKPRRDPGSTIKLALKREVNFGCPVRYPNGGGCGCPVLTYHHFDPTWAEAFAHNVDGMIALCKQHHDLADGGQWTMAQLRAMKRTPFVDEAVRVQWPYAAESLVIKVGKSLIVGSGSPIRLNNRSILEFRSEAIESLATRTVVFDADIRDADGKPWLRIDDSWFDLRLAGTTEVDFRPQAKTLVARHSDSTFISLRYRRFKFKEIGSWLAAFLEKQDLVDGGPASIETAGAIDSDGNVPVLELQGHFRTKDVELRIGENDMMFRCFIPGLEEECEFGSWIADGAHRMQMCRADGRAFFGLG